MKISNRKSSNKVDALEEFKANNIFAENCGNLYIVYSYGYHFPMYIFDRKTDTWYGNSSKYSVTTSKHMNQSAPNKVQEWLDCEAMKSLKDSMA